MNTAIVKMLVDKVLSGHQKFSEMNIGASAKAEYLEAIELWRYINSKLINTSALDCHVWRELSVGERRLKQ